MYVCILRRPNTFTYFVKHMAYMFNSEQPVVRGELDVKMKKSILATVRSECRLSNSLF